MKKIYLTKITQKTKDFYAMVADPRLIVELLPEVEAGDSQEAQRPWSKKKVKEISQYVSGTFQLSSKTKALGIIPNNPIIDLKDKIEVKKEIVTIYEGNEERSEERYYILLPKTTEERKEYKGSIEVIDGQHRLRAFSPDNRDISDRVMYNMVFSVFENLSMDERREIFMITNEKQDKVSVNLLRLFKKYLGLLGEEEKVFDIITSLNEDPFSVLYKRITVGSDKVTKGYAESQLSRILKRSGTIDKIEIFSGNDITKTTKLITNYLKGWERVYNVCFQNPGKETLTKISGLRYVFYLFPEIIEILVKDQKTATIDNFEDIILELSKAINSSNVFEEYNLAFRGEGATVKLAKQQAKILSTYFRSKNIDFDLTSGI